MHIVLFLLSAFVAFGAFSTSMSAATSIHQIYGGVMWIIAVLLFIGAAIVGAVHQSAAKITKQLQDQDDRLARESAEVYGRPLPPPRDRGLLDTLLK